MDPLTILSGIMLLAKEAPALYAEFKALMTKADPTEQDWNDLRAKILENGYKDFVPTTLIPQEKMDAAQEAIVSLRGANQSLTNQIIDLAGKHDALLDQVINLGKQVSTAASAPGPSGQHEQTTDSIHG